VVFLMLTVFLPRLRDRSRAQIAPLVTTRRCSASPHTIDQRHTGHGEEQDHGAYDSACGGVKVAPEAAFPRTATQSERPLSFARPPQIEARYD